MANTGVVVLLVVLLVVEGCLCSRDRPTGLRLDVYSSDTVRVVWEYPMDIKQKFDNYRLNISGDRTESRLVGASYRTLVSNLTPSTTYTMTLEARYAGTNNFGTPSQATATTFAKGTDMPRDLTAEAISATSAKLTWKPPINTNLEMKVYALKVGNKLVEIDYYDFNGTYTIGGLKPLRGYKVSVQVAYEHPTYLAPAATTTVKTSPSSRLRVPKVLGASCHDHSKNSELR
ncbi:hypothetical protein AAHC03_023068 [Spirometra sp. Aus1]